MSIVILVITHGVFGQELLRTAQDIIGRQEGVAGLGVTSEMGLENLSKAIDQTLSQLPSPDGYLFLGGGETTLITNRSFEPVRTGKAACYRLRG